MGAQICLYHGAKESSSGLLPSSSQRSLLQQQRPLEGREANLSGACWSLPGMGLLSSKFPEKEDVPLLPSVCFLSRLVFTLHCLWTDWLTRTK